jgi:cytochrome P450
MAATLSKADPIVRHTYPDGHLGWLVTDFKLGREVLADPRFSQRPLRFPVDDGGFQESLSGPESAGDLLRIDPPDHTRVRQLQTGYFTVKRVAEHRHTVERIVAECLDVIEEHGSPADLVELFSYPVPSMTICELLGVGADERWRFEHPMAVLADFTGTTGDDKKSAMVDFYAYVREVIEQKRAQPGDDLLSELVSSGQLTDNELAGVTFFLFAGGHHTTATVLSLSVLFLLSERERWEAARADLASIDLTVEELLRYVSPIRSLPRTATEDVEVGGVVIKAGESVTVHVPIPSGDPEQVDDLDRFDHTREPIAHHGFGWGRHMCLGQHLARLELQVELEGLMRRFPNLHLAVPVDEVPIRYYEVPGLGKDPTMVEKLLVAW